MVKLQETTTSVVCRTGQGQVQHKDDGSISSDGEPFVNLVEVHGIKDSSMTSNICEEDVDRENLIQEKSPRAVKRKRQNSSASDQSDSCRSCVHAGETAQKNSMRSAHSERIPNKNDVPGAKWGFIEQRKLSVINCISEMNQDGIQWKKNQFFFLIFILNMVIKVTSGAGIDCPTISVATVKDVKSCPMNMREYKEAARQMNCSQFESSECTDLQYHCLVNGFGNCTVEVCAKGILVQKGYCAEYNERGKKVQISTSVKPTSNPPGDHYYSTAAYKYPQCYGGILSLHEPTLASTPMVTNELASVHSPENSTMSTEEKKPSIEYIWIIGGLILPGVSIVILLLFFIRKKKWLTKEGTIAGDEDDHLIRTCTGNHASNGVVVDLAINCDGSGNKEEELPVDEQGQQMDGAIILH